MGLLNNQQGVVDPTQGLIPPPEVVDDGIRPRGGRGRNGLLGFGSVGPAGGSSGGRLPGAGTGISSAQDFLSTRFRTTDNGVIPIEPGTPNFSLIQFINGLQNQFDEERKRRQKEDEEGE